MLSYHDKRVGGGQYKHIKQDGAIDQLYPLPTVTLICVSLLLQPSPQLSLWHYYHLGRLIEQNTDSEVAIKSCPRVMVPMVIDVLASLGVSIVVRVGTYFFL